MSDGDWVKRIADEAAEQQKQQKEAAKQQQAFDAHRHETFSTFKKYCDESIKPFFQTTTREMAEAGFIFDAHVAPGMSSQPTIEVSAKVSRANKPGFGSVKVIAQRGAGQASRVADGKRWRRRCASSHRGRKRGLSPPNGPGAVIPIQEVTVELIRQCVEAVARGYLNPCSTATVSARHPLSSRCQRNSTRLRPKRPLLTSAGFSKHPS